MINTTKTLDERFNEKFSEGLDCVPMGLPRKLKQFINQELDNLAQQFLEAIPKESKIDWSKEKNCYGRAAEEHGYNQAIQEIKKKIEEIIKEL